MQAKVRDWKSAIRQAIPHTWFSSYSYVLVPRLSNLGQLVEGASRFGIAVLVFNGEHTRVMQRAQKQRLPASDGSWLLNEWASRVSQQREQ